MQQSVLVSYSSLIGAFFEITSVLFLTQLVFKKIDNVIKDAKDISHPTFGPNPLVVKNQIETYYQTLYSLLFLLTGFIFQIPQLIFASFSFNQESVIHWKIVLLIFLLFMFVIIYSNKLVRKTSLETMISEYGKDDLKTLEKFISTEKYGEKATSNFEKRYELKKSKSEEDLDYFKRLKLFILSYLE